MKVDLGIKNCLYPMPTTLVGTTVNGKPNYLPIAHVGISGMAAISISLNKRHYSNSGIKESGTFSVNLPTEGMVRETDYCGLVSGKDIDKTQLFETFYGKLQTAPMIKECPVNMECRLLHIIDFTTHELFIGEIAATYCDDQYLTEGAVDCSKIKPIFFVMHDRSYWKLGERFAKAWHIGKELKTPKVV